MSITQVSATFGHAFKSVREFFDFDSKGGEKRIRYVIGMVAALALCITGYFGYRWYSISRDEAAQKEFSTLITRYAQSKTSEQQDSLLVELGLAHDQYARSSMAPYFSAYEVDILLEQGKKMEALTALDSMINSLSSSNPLIYLYQTKRALLKFDLDDEAIAQEGLQELEQLAQNKKNKQRDLAQYYLGLYYFVNDQNQEAKKVWGDLVEESFSSESPSPWANQAKQKLEFMA